MNYNAILKNGRTVLNHEGEVAYVMTPEMELYTAVVTASLSDKFYESCDSLVGRIPELVPQVSPEFVAELAIYTRREMNLRSVPLLLLVELAKCHNGDNLVSRAVAATVMRADEISELLACYQWRNPSSGIKKLGKLSRQIQDGLKIAFNKFNEYQFAKYDRDGEVTLKDALFLVHPKADSAQKQEIFDKIVADKLEIPYTWETQLSALGQKNFGSPEEKNLAKKALWEELLDSGKLGYMALLRNLRNILESGVSGRHIESLCKRLADPVQVKASKQLPFRFLAAYKEMLALDNMYRQCVMDALEEAVKASAQGIKGFDIGTKVLLACDVSGSMFSPVSQRSRIVNAEIGILLASMLRIKSRCVLSGIFGDVWKTVLASTAPVLENTVGVRNMANRVGYSTNGYRVIDWLIDRDVRMDKVIFFTDCQLWNSNYGDGNIRVSWAKYKAKYPEAKLYIFDLAGYGQSPLDLSQKDVYLIAGWNEKVFDVLDAVENGADVLSLIKNIPL